MTEKIIFHFDKQGKIYTKKPVAKPKKIEKIKTTERKNNNRSSNKSFLYTLLGTAVLSAAVVASSYILEPDTKSLESKITENTSSIENYIPKNNAQVLASPKTNLEKKSEEIKQPEHRIFSNPKQKEKGFLAKVYNYMFQNPSDLMINTYAKIGIKDEGLLKDLTRAVDKLTAYIPPKIITKKHTIKIRNDKGKVIERKTTLDTLRIIPRGWDKTKKDYENTYSQLSRFRDMFESESKKSGLDAILSKSMTAQESKGIIKAKSYAGAKGLTQFMPLTAREYGMQENMYINESYDPQESIRANNEYMNALLKMFNGNAWHAIAAYNCGEGSLGKIISRHGPEWNDAKNHLPIQTKDYVIRVLTHYMLQSNMDNYGLHPTNKRLFSEKLANTHTHITKKKETISSIAKDYKVSPKAIVEVNPILKNQSRVGIGMALRVPKKDITYNSTEQQSYRQGKGRY